MRFPVIRLKNRISMFVNLPFVSLDKPKLQEKLDEIGRTRLAEESTEASAQ
jgi:hypothetical protein